MPIGQEKSSGTWWKVLLGVLGGFFLGIGTVAGGVAIAGTVVKTKTLLGDQADKILSPEFQEKTILEIVMDAVGGKLKFDTIGDLNNITPLVGEYVTGVKESLNGLGCELTNEEIYTWSISKLSDHLVDSVMEAKLIRVLSGDNIDYPDPVIKFLSYDTYTTGPNIGEYRLDAEGKLIPMQLQHMLKDSNYIQRKVDTMRLKMLFTEEDIKSSSLLSAIQDKTVKELANNGGFDDVKISDVMTINDSSTKILRSFKENEVTIGGMSDAIDDLELSEVIDITDSSPIILKTFAEKEVKVSEMNDAINELKLCEVMELKEGDLLWNVRNDSINDLSTIDERLTVGDVFGDDLSEMKFLNCIPAGTAIKDIGDEINDVKLVQAFQDEIFEADGSVKDTWKYMLAETAAERSAIGSVKVTDHDGDPFVDFKCYNYTLSGKGGTDDKGINGLIDNMSSNMKTATLINLSDDGIVTLDPDFLDKDIDLGGSSPVQYKKKSYYASLGKTKFGHLTIEELSDLVTAGLETVSP